jgi:enoyl-[acyl-carrier protein] reductase II
VRNGYTQHWEDHPDQLKPFPMQFLQSMEDGANHLGRGEDEEGVDPAKEFYPAGQGVGSIHELVPAGELVERFVAEAEEVLGRLADLRAVTAP